MRRMFSEKQIKEMISAGVQSEIAEALEGDIEVGGDLSVAGDSSVTGDQSVGGDLEVTGDVSGDNITGNSIIENMSGYSFVLGTKENLTIEAVYAGIVKNGNKITFVMALNLTRTGTVGSGELAQFVIPSSIGEKLFPTLIGGSNYLDVKIIPAFSDYTSKVDFPSFVNKNSDTRLALYANTATFNSLTIDTKYYYRYEATFLLSDNLAPSGE